MNCSFPGCPLPGEVLVNTTWGHLQVEGAPLCAVHLAAVFWGLQWAKKNHALPLNTTADEELADRLRVDGGLR